MKSPSVAELKPYPQMKDSGAEWLGEVPAHWAVERLKSSVANVVEQNTDRHQLDSPIALEHVESWTGQLHSADCEVSSDSQLKRFEPGDVLFGKLRPYLAKVTRPANSGLCVGEFLVLRPRKAELASSYVEQLLRSRPAIDAVDSATFGAKMPRTDWSFIGSMAVVRPPLSEQTAIVRFLDHADRRIRRYVHAKQKLIALLEEQERAIVHQAVTGQIDVRTGQPYPAYAPSGVEWLPEVPEHWGRIPLGAAVDSVQTGPFGSQLHASDYVSGGIPVINPSHVRNASIEPDPLISVRQGKAEELSRHQLRPGDIVVARRGEMGRSALVSETEAGWLCGTGSLRIRPRCGILLPTFLLLALKAPGIRDTLRLASIGATMDNLNAGMVSRLMLIRPPSDEQKAIVDFVEGWSIRVEKAKASAHRQISFLREYRTRLIADVVTGKLDVRDAAARLPTEDTTPRPHRSPGEVRPPRTPEAAPS